MVKIITFLFFCVIGFVVLIPEANAQKKKGYKLVWEDEFKNNGLPDPAKWGYEVGHIRNREKQYYTNARKENIEIKEGMLAITGRKEIFQNQGYTNGDQSWQRKDSLAQYTSASINTESSGGWQYGRIEVKAKMPAGGGMWPAIWMMGINRSKVGWPLCGEIDIMEFIGNHPKEIYGTVHYPTGPNKAHKSNGSIIKDESLSSAFHLYAIEWDREKIDFYFDNKQYHSFLIDSAGLGDDNPFRKPFYLLLNFAMGADWPGPINDAVLPQQFVVDYVRVYQKKIK
ncbi:MAG: glycoside hydrolase family 16 protein [Chitinophagaceae bacterium]